MDKSKLKELIAAAIADGTCPPSLGVRANQFATIAIGEVSRASLLHTYLRRSRRTGTDSTLRAQTLELISFLEQYPGDTLNMISATLEGDGYELFLADSPLTKVLYWMGMFSR